MTPKRKMTLGLLIASATVSSCAMGAGEGLFCDVVSAPIIFPPPVAEMVVRDARQAGVQIDTQNRYGEANCPRWR